MELLLSFRRSWEKSIKTVEKGYVVRFIGAAEDRKYYCESLVYYDLCRQKQLNKANGKVCGVDSEADPKVCAQQ